MSAPIHDRVLLTQLLNSGMAALRPIDIAAETAELARPFLAPATTWQCLLHGLDPGRERAALLALSMLVSTHARPSCVWWLTTYGSRPDSREARAARTQHVRCLPVLGCDDYVRAMAYWSTVGVFEYLLVRQLCDPFNPQLAARCQALIGKTEAQL